jgi:hypothetical protein
MRDRLAQGALRAADIVEACLAVIAAREPEVQAWAWLDGDHAMAQAKALDAHRAVGRPDRAAARAAGGAEGHHRHGHPTENGTALDAGRVPTATPGSSRG